MDQNVMDKVTKLVCEQLNVNKEQVTAESSFADDLGADSLDVVELVMAFEEGFSVEIPDEDVEKIPTVGAAVEYIVAKLNVTA